MFISNFSGGLSVCEVWNLDFFQIKNRRDFSPPPARFLETNHPNGFDRACCQLKHSNVKKRRSQKTVKVG